MAWEFIAAGMYMLALLTMFVMTLTRSQGPSTKEDEEKRKHRLKSDKVIYKKAA